MKTLRPHQARAIEMLRASVRSGKKRPVLKLPTGAGKTLIASHIIQSSRDKGNRVLFVVDAIQLVDQTVQAFYDAGLRDIGVIQGQHPITDYSRGIQVASIQSLVKRKTPEFGLCIIDECHALHKAHKDLIAAHPTVPFIGLSATPWTKGLGHHFDDLIQPASIRELTELGWVAELQAFAPSHPDLTGVKVRAGEFQDDQLSKVMRGEKLVADIVETWKKLGQERQTLCFCVDRAHAAAMQERFQQAWIGCGYIDGTMDAREREAVRRQLEAGEIQVVVSVGTMIKGVDWKFGTIIDAQPTKSYMRHVQKLGRLRKFPEWDYGIVLDHSDNILRLGLPIDIHRDDLCTAKKGDKADVDAIASKPKAGCPKCSFVKTKPSKTCPQCGYEAKVLPGEINEATGELALVGGDKKGPAKNEPTPAAKEEFYRELLGWAARNGKEERHASGKFKSKFGHWPVKKRGLTPLAPTPETLSWIRAANIRYIKGIQKGAQHEGKR